MIRFAALSVLLFLAPIVNADEPPAFQFEKGDSALGIPFELNSNKIYLPVRIDGGERRWFILDSGCPVTAIDLELARELKLPVEHVQPLSGAGEGRTDRGDTEIRSLTLPGLELHPGKAWALGVNKPVSPFEGRKIDGLLGADFLERFVVRIDYPNGKLDVFLPKVFKPTPGAIEVPVEEVAGHYAVHATLKGQGKTVEGKFVFDVGVRLPLTVNTPFVNKHGLIEALGAKNRATVGGGLGGEVVHHLARLESIQIGKLEIPAPYVTLSQERRSELATDTYQGLMGAEVFRRYRITLDFPGKRVFFEETPLAKSPYEFDMSGMFLVAGGEDYRTFKVFSVMAGGPADEAGVKKGDIITEVNNLPAAKLTLEKLRASFREAGATRELSLERDGEKKVVKIKLRRLV